MRDSCGAAQIDFRLRDFRRRCRWRSLLWLILAGPGYFGYGASLLWAGLPKAGAANFYDIGVDPGNKLIRRRSDQMVTAQLTGFQAPQVQLDGSL